MSSVLAQAELLLAEAKRLRVIRAREAEQDIDALRNLLPIPRKGAARQQAGEHLLDLSSRQNLAALGVKSLDQLFRAHALRLTATTARRLIDEHQESGRPVPARDRRLLRTLETRIAKALRTGDAKAWEIGKLVARVASRRLHRLGTDDLTLPEWADARFPHHGWRTLSRYRRISQFPRSVVARHGVLKLDLGLQYLDLTPDDDKPADLLKLQILVPKKGLISFLEITAADLQRAVDALRTIRSTPKPTKLPRAAGTTLTRLRQSLANQAPEGAPPPVVEARTVRAGDKMIVMITVHNLPLELAQRLLPASAGRA